MAGTNGTTNPTAIIGGEDIAKAVACFAVILISLLGNLLVILSVKRNLHGKMRTVNSYLIANMSVADFLFSLHGIYSVVIYIIHKGAWHIGAGHFGQALCKLDMFFSVALVTTTVLNLVAIAVDRFCAVFLPIQKIITPGVGKTLLVLTWLISAVYSAPLLYFSEMQSMGIMSYCGFGQKEEKQLLRWYKVQSVLIVLALIVISTVYVAIMVKLIRRKPPGNLTTVAFKRREKQNRDISKMLVTLVLAFYVCFLPQWVIQLSLYFGFSHLMPRNSAFNFISNFLLLLNGAVNPFIYGKFCRNYQMSFKYFVPRWCCHCPKVNFRKAYIANDSQLNNG